MAAIDQKPSALSVFSKGLLIENPTLRQMLGLCPTLAVTTAVTNGIGMGVATTFVLVCSGIVVSLLRNIIPTTMRLPAFITVIAGFVTIVMMVVEAYLPDLNQALGIYLPLITTNCAVLGVTILNLDEGYTFGQSLVNAVGSGLGFLLAMVLFSGVRSRVDAAAGSTPKAFQGIPITLVAAATPVASSTAIFAQKFGQDYRQAVTYVCLSTVLSIVTLPLVMLLAEHMLA